MSRGDADRRRAVALCYEAGEGAPRIAAKGYGETAEAIIDKAREHGLCIQADAPLVEMLMDCDLDARIPPALYVAVAELIVWVMELDRAID